MNSLNALGIRMFGITLIAVLIGFGILKGVELGVSQYQHSKIAKITPTPTPLITVEPTLAPEVKQEITAIADTAKQTLVGYTKKYIESLPKDIAKNQVLDPKTVETFVDANRGKLLPDLPAGTVQTTTKSGKQAIQAYLDAVSPGQNSSIKTVTGDMITSALGKQESGEELQALVPIIASIKNNFTVFQAVQAPKEATALQTKLLQATQALINNVKLLQEMRNDTVGGLIGQKNLADLNGVFNDIGTQIIALETKYNIK